MAWFLQTLIAGFERCRLELRSAAQIDKISYLLALEHAVVGGVGGLQSRQDVAVQRAVQGELPHTRAREDALKLQDVAKELRQQMESGCGY